MVDIIITTPINNKKSITLYNIALVPGFFINLVLFSKAIEKGIY